MDGGRIIPAHAGNSDYAGGGSPLGNGSSPRMRGTQMRGSRLRDVMPDHPRACGELNLEHDPYRVLTDHPRACGELGIIFAFLACGSSPRRTR